MFQNIHITRASKKAVRNDMFRQRTGCVLSTQGILSAIIDLKGLMSEVAEFDKFTKSNDPYGEHDFGVLMWEDEMVIWKIDYYDADRKHYCDPLSPDCNRVLTVMLAEEY